jgi:predicted transcriptional regulator
MTEPRSIDVQIIKPMKITAPQLRAARALLGLSQDDLADKSGVSKPTIGRLSWGVLQSAGTQAPTKSSYAP